MAAVTLLGSDINSIPDGLLTATPTLNDLIVIVAHSTGVATPTWTVSDDQSGAYTQIGSNRNNGSNNGVISIWVRNALVSSAVSTIYTGQSAAATGGGLAVFAVSGMSKTGATASKQSSGTATGAAGGTPSVVLGGAVLTTNPVIGIVQHGTNSSTAVTPATNYTERYEAGHASPNQGYEGMTRDSGETASTINWGGTVVAAWSAIVLELDASSAAVTMPPRPKIILSKTANNW